VYYIFAEKSSLNVRESSSFGSYTFSCLLFLRSPNKSTVTAMFKSAFRHSPLVLLPLCLLLFSCGTQRNGPLLIVPAGRQGLVHGGQQPVTGATIQLYAVGTAGDGSAATPLLSPAAVSDANGGFNISGAYHCPSASSLVYIVASGGNPGLGPGINNAALSLMAALGPCGNLSPSTFIFIDELTTVAAVYALAPYMTSPSAVGSASGDATALAAAFTLASQLVNTTTGTAPGTGVPTGTSVPVAQINTIGDILGACVNSAGGTSGDSTPCGMLFSLTTPTGLTPATDTVTALLHLANDPALNTASLFNLVTPGAPFQPTQSQTPPDLSVRLTVPSGFTVSPAEIDFPATRLFASSAPLSFTFTNNTAAPVGIGIAALSFLSPTLSGANPYDFSLSSPPPLSTNPENCPIPVMPGATCTLWFVFRPGDTGARSAYFTITNSTANPVISLLMTGTGLEANAGPASLSPVSLSFTAAGTPANATLTNSGTLPLIIDGISISNDPISGQPAFTQTNNCGASLASLATCTIAVTALSTTQLYPTGTLTVADDAANGPQSMTLSYSNGFIGPLRIDFGSRSIGTQGGSGFSFQPPGLPPGGTYALALTGADATDFSFASTSSSLTTTCTASRLSPNCIASVYFTPSALGQRIATLTVNGMPDGGIVGIGLSPGLHFSGGPGSLNFGSVVVGQSSSAMGIGITNIGSVPIAWNAPVLTGPNASDFSVVSTCPASLAPNAFCAVNLRASPTQPTNRFATLTLTDSTGTLQQVTSLAVFGQNPGPAVNPTTLAFGYTLLGTTSAPQSFTVTGFNNDPVTLQVVDPSSPFVVTQGSSCSSTPCQISVAFAPTAANTAPTDYYSSGQILITDLFSSQVTQLPLSGIHDLATPPPPTTLTIDSNSLTFDPQMVGSTSSGQTLTLTNTGNQLLYVAILITGANPGDYVLSNPCSQLAAAGQGFNTCTFFVQFSPTATGTRTANVQIISNTPSSPDLVSLTGTGQ
jgi:hypothetical protein